MEIYKEELFKKFKLDKHEKDFVEKLNDNTFPSMTVHKALTDFYLAKQIGEMSHNTRYSIERLTNYFKKFEESSSKSQDRMFWLTVAIFFAGAIQAISTFISLFFK